MIYVKDTEGRYVLINRRYEELFHVTKESIRGKTDLDLFPKERAEAFRANDLRALQAGRSLESEELVPQDDGLHTYISIKFPLRDTAGAPFATCGISTGLGLATCYGIVQQSEGHIGFYSEVDRGTTVKVYLPRVREQPVRSEAKEKAQLPRGTETVLLVEDEPQVRAVGVRVLREQGYRVLEAANGEEAQELAARHAGEIDLLLTDVVMPRMGGKELADRLRAREPRLKVLFMSGYLDGALGQKGVLEPDVAFLSKPFTAATLAQRLRQVLDGRCDDIR